jgi:GntR family transcriptional regulator
MVAVDRSSPMPVYFQIALDVRRRIAAGEWRAGERIAPELQLLREYAVSRVTIRINDEPTAVYRSWFDAARVPGLESARGLDGSLSAVIADDYGLVPVRAENALEVVRFTREDAELLNSTHDVPLLVVSSTTYLPDGAPLEYAQMMWLGDRVRFHFTSQRPNGGSPAPAPARRARSQRSPSTPPESG